ncbi:hypothetical protein ACOMHN_031225 [Nucella lapillus]
MKFMPMSTTVAFCRKLFFKRDIEETMFFKKDIEETMFFKRDIEETMFFKRDIEETMFFKRDIEETMFFKRDIEETMFCKVATDTKSDSSLASQRGPPPGSLDSRRPSSSQQRSVTFDLYPTTFAARGSGRLPTFPTSRLADDVREPQPRQAMTSFSSFSPLARNGPFSRAGSTSSSTSSSLPPSRRHPANGARHHGDDLPLPLPATSSQDGGEGEEGSYVDLKRQQRRPVDDYMDMSGAPYTPASQLSVATSGTWDGETTTSGSYSVAPRDRARDVDPVFFHTAPKDVVV